MFTIAPGNDLEVTLLGLWRQLHAAVLAELGPTVDVSQLTSLVLERLHAPSTATQLLESVAKNIAHEMRELLADVPPAKPPCPCGGTLHVGCKPLPAAPAPEEPPVPSPPPPVDEPPAAKEDPAPPAVPPATDPEPAPGGPEITGETPPANPDTSAPSATE